MNDTLIKMLEKERMQLLLKLKLVEEALDAYKSPGIIPARQVPGSNTAGPGVGFEQSLQALFQKYYEYNSAAPTRNKILFIIKAENRFLHVREIARIMQQLDDETSLSAVVKKVSPALSILKRITGTPLASIEVANSHFNTFWGYKEWLNEHMGIKDGFMYNQAEITKFQKENSFDLTV